MGSIFYTCESQDGAQEEAEMPMLVFPTRERLDCHDPAISWFLLLYKKM